MAKSNREYFNTDVEFKRYQVNRTLCEILDSADYNDKVTKRLKERMKKLSLKKSFTNIADGYGISHTIVRICFEECVEYMNKR